MILDTFEAILVGPDGGVHFSLEMLKPDEANDIIPRRHIEGPFRLTSHYRRTGHTVRGLVRFDWVDSTRDDNGEIYRLASVDGLGEHNLVNDLK